MSKDKGSPDWIILIITFGLLMLGWVMQYSSGAIIAEERFGDQYYYLKRHMLWSFIGIVFFLAAMKLDLKFIRRCSKPLTIITVFWTLRLILTKTVL